MKRINIEDFLNDLFSDDTQSDETAAREFHRAIETEIACAMTRLRHQDEICTGCLKDVALKHYSLDELKGIQIGLSISLLMRDDHYTTREWLMHIPQMILEKERETSVEKSGQHSNRFTL